MYDEATERGRITWHCSDPEGGPDVGLSLGLGGNALLWAGGISKDVWTKGGPDVAHLGDDTGWWLLLYAPERIVLGKFADAYYAQDFIEKLAATLIADGYGLPPSEPDEAAATRALQDIEAMIVGCPDVPTSPDSLPQMILTHARAALASPEKAASIDRLGQPRSEWAAENMRREQEAELHAQTVAAVKEYVEKAASTRPAASDLRERARRMFYPQQLAETFYERLAAEFAAIRAEAESAHELEVQELYIEAQRLGFERGKKWQRDYGAVSTPGHVLNETRLASMKPQREGK